MDIKAWLETTGLPVKEEQYLKAPALPYIVFSDEAIAGYKYLNQTKTDHNLTVQLYASAIDRTSEGLIEALIDAAQPFVNGRYNRKRMWVENETAFVTTYDFVYEEID